MKRRIGYPLFLVILTMTIGSQILYGQIGAANSFEFLNLAQSARTNALGGYSIAILDDDVNLAYQNPALLNKDMIGSLAFNHNIHFADINYGFASIALSSPLPKSHMSLGFNYINYGSFDRADLYGNRAGEFDGREAAFTVGFSKEVRDRLRVGTNLRLIRSAFDSYNSWGFSMDLGVTYSKPESRSHFSLVISHIGRQFSTFSEIRESPPLNVLLGFSKRLEHLPFRVMITAHHINQWNLRNDFDTDPDPIFQNTAAEEESGFSKQMENLFRHLSFGGELLLGKNEIFRLRFGYNHNRKKDLAVNGYRSLSGLSYGFGVKVKKIAFDYSVSRYHLAGGVNHLSLRIHLKDLFNGPAN